MVKQYSDIAFQEIYCSKRNLKPQPLWSQHDGIAKPVFSQICGLKIDQACWSSQAGLEVVLF